MKIYTAGCLFGVLVVAAGCLLLELRDNTIRNPEDLRQLIRFPVLGGVSSFHAATDAAHAESGIPHPALRYLHAPNSIEAENYRAIRTALTFIAEDRDARVLQVSSPDPNDGKTTLLGNLAVALSQSGKRILLIDADLRRPNVHRLFRIPQGSGLADVLTGTVGVDSVIRPTSITNLSIMTSGKSPENPAELLSAPQLRRVIEEARSRFDYVLIDGPPLLAVSDAAIVARQADGLILTVRLGKNTRSNLLRAREIIRGHGIPVLGVVANGVTRKNSGAGYYQAYPQRTETGPAEESANSRVQDLVGVS